MSDEVFGFWVIVVAGALFTGGYFSGKYMEHRKYQYGCGPGELVAYTDGYRECKEGK